MEIESQGHRSFSNTNQRTYYNQKIEYKLVQSFTYFLLL